MIEVIEPLARTPGVLVAALVTEDGVPVAVPGQGENLDGLDSAKPYADGDVLAALSASWMDDLARAVGKLSWENPQKVVLRAARGTLMMLPASGAVLVVVLEPGLGPEQLWLPMEGAAARIERILRGMGRTTGIPLDVDETQEPPAAIPASGDSVDKKERVAKAAAKRNPKRTRGM